MYKICMILETTLIDKYLITMLAGVLHIVMFLLNVSLEI